MSIGIKELVRDIGIELGTFDLSDLAACGIAYSSAHRTMQWWVADGRFERIGDGPYGRAQYRYVPPAPAAPVNRVKRPPPELEVVRALQRRGPVAGTGKGPVVRDADTRRVIAQLKDAGCEVTKPPRGGHYRVRRGGETIATISASSSDWRALANLRSELARQGISL